jgi:hypothetical protein
LHIGFPKSLVSSFLALGPIQSHKVQHFLTCPMANIHINGIDLSILRKNWAVDCICVIPLISQVLWVFIDQINVHMWDCISIFSNKK